MIPLITCKRAAPTALSRCKGALLRCAVQERRASVSAAAAVREIEDLPMTIPYVATTHRKAALERRVEEVKKTKPVSDFLTDTFKRQHDYLRISITERCNLRCLYCMPEEGIPLSPSANMLTTPEIFYLSSLFVSQGVTKIRLTGGEPTVRRDIVPLMQQIGSLRSQGLRELALTTNGIALHRKLDAMVEAGLTGVNLSLDTLDPFQFQIMTRRKGFDAVMNSIERILEMNKLGANVKLKVNCVVMRGLNEREIIPFVELGREKDIEVRFIEYMPFGGNKWSQGKMFSFQEMLDTIRAKYPSLRAVPGHKNDTSKTFEVPGFVGKVGFITSMTNDFCGTCNRLRITSDGNLKVCLHGNTEVSLRDLLREDNAGQPIDEVALQRIRKLEIDRHEGRSPAETALGWGPREQQLLGVIGAAVKRKAEKHADMGDLEKLTNRPMILIDELPKPPVPRASHVPILDNKHRKRYLPTTTWDATLIGSSLLWNSQPTYQTISVRTYSTHNERIVERHRTAPRRDSLETRSKLLTQAAKNVTSQSDWVSRINILVKEIHEAKRQLARFRADGIASETAQTNVPRTGEEGLKIAHKQPQTAQAKSQKQKNNKNLWKGQSKDKEIMRLEEALMRKQTRLQHARKGLQNSQTSVAAVPKKKDPGRVSQDRKSEDILSEFDDVHNLDDILGRALAKSQGGEDLATPAIDQRLTISSERDVEDLKNNEDSQTSIQAHIAELIALKEAKAQELKSLGWVESNAKTASKDVEEQPQSKHKITTPPDSQLAATSTPKSRKPLDFAALYAPIPSSGLFPIDSALTLDFSAPTPSLRSQIRRLEARLRTAYPGLDTLPFDVASSSKHEALGTWLRVLAVKWTAQNARGAGAKEEAGDVIARFLDQMVEEHNLSAQAAERMTRRLVAVFERRENGVKEASVDVEQLQAEGMGLLADNMDSDGKETRTATNVGDRSPGSGGNTVRPTSSSIPKRPITYTSNAPSQLHQPAHRSYSTKSPSQPTLPHLTPTGTAHMVSVTRKPSTHRIATAIGHVSFTNSTPLSLIQTNSLKKGDVLGVARIAGIMAAKKCPEIVVLCHPIALEGVNVEVRVVLPDATGIEGGVLAPAASDASSTSVSPKIGQKLRLPFGGVSIEASVSCTGPTGVEMEALTAVMGAALSVVDMCKAVDRGMRIEGVRVVRKEGGRSGVFAEEGWEKDGDE